MTPLLSSLGQAEIARRLAGPGLGLRSGRFGFRIRSPIESIAAGMGLLYADYPLLAEDEFADFRLDLPTGTGLHRFWRPQVKVLHNNFRPFEPLPLAHAYPQMEWAMNWCIAGYAHDYLMLHAAVLERDGLALVLPAPPGSGKSTLCAGLLHRGWRLLTDELALVSLDEADRRITPLVRPVSIKNESVEVLRRFEPAVVFNEVTHGTAKGSVTHMKVPAEQVRRMDEVALPRWLVFPRYVPEADPVLLPRSRADSAIELGRNSFNYPLLGRQGFEALGDLVDACHCYDFSYSRLDDAVEVFDGLVRAEREGATR
ncbi:HprK-related kinase A [Pelomonas sp. KK5]|uniref:HprK-related kinase A n=1 Tax=Pelomonas sp. KK5 TaxID=1855730 RepID=UPI00097C493E|nr:HprK-related kinase A [Pelomonas sp. KK5]